MIGYIPKKIHYIIRNEQSAYWEWDNWKRVDSNIKVYPAFPFDPEKSNTRKTAQLWSGADNPTEIETDNNSISAQILTYEIRSEGGRAWKAIISIDGKDLYVDLREDVLLDTLLKTGSEKDGRLNGKFIWGKIGSQTKLVRIGSDLHENLIQATKDKAAKKLKLSDLEIGGVYQNRKDEKFLYLGHWYVLQSKHHPERINKTLWYPMQYILSWEKQHVWLKTGFDSIWQYYRIGFTKSMKSLVKKVDQIDTRGWIKKIQQSVAFSIKSDRSRFWHRDNLQQSIWNAQNYYYFKNKEDAKVQPEEGSLFTNIVNSNKIEWE